MKLTVYDEYADDDIERGNEKFILDDLGNSLVSGFCANLDRAAKNSTFFRNAPSIKTIRMTRENGWDVELSKSYTYEQLAAALTLCRPLMLKNEVCSFQKTHHYLWERAQSEIVKCFMAQIADQFLNGQFSHYANFWSNDKVLLSNQSFEVWLNAEHFHRGGDKAEKYKKLNATLGVAPTDKVMVSQFSQRIFAMISLRYALDIPHGLNDYPHA